MGGVTPEVTPACAEAQGFGLPEEVAFGFRSSTALQNPVRLGSGDHLPTRRGHYRAKMALRCCTALSNKNAVKGVTCPSLLAWLGLCAQAQAFSDSE